MSFYTPRTTFVATCQCEKQECLMLSLIFPLFFRAGGDEDNREQTGRGGLPNVDLLLPQTNTEPQLLRHGGQLAQASQRPLERAGENRKSNLLVLLLPLLRILLHVSLPSVTTTHWLDKRVYRTVVTKAREASRYLILNAMTPMPLTTNKPCPCPARLIFLYVLLERAR